MESAGIKESLLPFTKEKDPQMDLSKYYEQYQRIIDTIIEKCSGNKISRYAFDHILWYFSKLKQTSSVHKMESRV